MAVLGALVPCVSERTGSALPYKTGVWGVSSPTLRETDIFQVGYSTSVFPLTAVTNSRWLLGNGPSYMPPSAFPNSSSGVHFSCFSISALLLFADLQCCPITISSCKLSIFAIRQVCRFAADNNQLFCTHCPKSLGCLFIKLSHNHFLHQPAWISFPLNISLSIDFPLQREERSFYIPRWSDSSPPVPGAVQVWTEI